MLANPMPLFSLAPYERRVIELLRNSKDKRARKLAKKRVCISRSPKYLIPILQLPPDPQFLIPENYYPFNLPQGFSFQSNLKIKLANNADFAF